MTPYGWPCICRRRPGRGRDSLGDLSKAPSSVTQKHRMAIQTWHPVSGAWTVVSNVGTGRNHHVMETIKVVNSLHGSVKSGHLIQGDSQWRGWWGWNA
jgi:uncharacterized protein YcaQ